MRKAIFSKPPVWPRDRREKVNGGAQFLQGILCSSAPATSKWMKRAATPTARAPEVLGSRSPGENSVDFSHHPSQFTRPGRGRARPPGGMLRGWWRTARRPTLTAARSAVLRSAPSLRRPGRAALPFRFREPRRRDRPSGCRHARALARRHGRRLRFAPRSCDGSRRGPKDLKALGSPALSLAGFPLSLPAPPCPAAQALPRRSARVPTPSLHKSTLSFKQCSHHPSIRGTDLCP